MGFVNLMNWPQPLQEFGGFVAAFLAYGAVGFRLFVLGGARPGADAESDFAVVASRAGRIAAWLGLLGSLIMALQLGMELPEQAAHRHVDLATFVTGNTQLLVQIGLMLVAIFGFASAAARLPGWALAAIGTFGGALRAALFAQWARLVNPVHMLAAGLWIGTLFVMVVAGFGAALRTDPAERRGMRVAALVNAFSPFALVCAAVLVSFGVLTAWRHLPTLSSLWTSVYGRTLIVKLVAVLGVVALGAWNWRRAKPRLGSEAAAHAIRRSAAAELTGAALVLAITAVLVSVPSPREAPSGTAAPVAPGARAGSPP